MSDERFYVERKKGINTAAFIVIVILVILISVLGTYTYLKNSGKMSEVTQNAANENLTTNTSNAAVKYEIETVQNPVVAVAKECSDSIVGISVDYITQNIFGMLQNSSSSGSGVVYSKDGYIITNYHVIQSAIESSNATVTVIMLDETKYKATIVGGDDVTDLAVLKIEADNLKPITIGDSSKVQVGEMAVAIGNPLGQTLAGSVTVGYISALNRKITSGTTTYNLIQTDAAINAGNSGGALLNTKGELIGINTVKAYSTGVEGLGFAIPVNDAKPILDELIKNGKIARPYIGVSGFTLNKEMAEKYNLVEGVYIQEVYDGTAAKKAGIKGGDIIVKIDDTDVKTFEEFNTYKNSKKVGDKVIVEIFRNGETKKLELILGEK